MNPDHLDAVAGPGGGLATALTDGEEVVLRVAGSCMEPAVDDRTAVRLKRRRFYYPGDVVAFHDPRHHRLVLHRFLGYVRRREEWKLMVMADRGAGPDPLVEKSCVLGRVIAQSGRPYKVSLVRRLGAARRYAAWCLRHLARRLTLHSS